MGDENSKDEEECRKDVQENCKRNRNECQGKKMSTKGEDFLRNCWGSCSLTPMHKSGSLRI